MMLFDLDIPKIGYNILVARGDIDPLGRLIEKWQLKTGFTVDQAQYTHVETSLGGPDSVCVAPPHTRLVNITTRYKGRRIRIVRLKEKNFDVKRYKVAVFAASICNLVYDWKGILAFILKWIKQNNKFYFCSEMCLWAIQKVYPNALSIFPEKSMPAHFLLPEFFEIVWEGVL